MFNSNSEKRGNILTPMNSEQRRPSLKDLWASNPSSSLHSLEPSYTDFRGQISFQSHSFEPPNNSAWAPNNFDHTQEWPTTSDSWEPNSNSFNQMAPIQHNSWTPPPYDSFQSMEHIPPPYWDPYSSYSYPDQSPNQGYDHAHSYDFSNNQWAQQSSYPSISHEPNISEWQTYSNSMNPSTFDHRELEEQTMDPLERMNIIVQEFAKSRGILIEENSPLDLTTHQNEPPFQTSMPDSLTYSSNNLDN